VSPEVIVEMGTAVLVEPRQVAVDARKILVQALSAAARKVGVPEHDITRDLRARDRMAWSRFRFELAREVGHVLVERFPQIRSIHLWELDEEVPEAPDAPAEPTLDLILRVDRVPAGLDDVALDLTKELGASFGRLVLETPLVLTTHVLTRAMLTSGRGMAALFRSPHQRPALVWSAD
jgi:hypothetical protein